MTEEGKNRKRPRPREEPRLDETNTRALRRDLIRRRLAEARRRTRPRGNAG